MIVKAAVIKEMGAPFEIQEVDLVEPRFQFLETISN